MKNYEPLVVRWLVQRETDTAHDQQLPDCCRWKELMYKVLDKLSEINNTPLKDIPLHLRVKCCVQSSESVRVTN